MSKSRDFVPAEGFPPAEYLAEELKERKWTQKRFCEESGMKPKRLKALLTGAELLAGDAHHIWRAFKTKPTVWMNLQDEWERWCVEKCRKERFGA